MKGKRFTLMLIALLCALITLCSCGTFNPAGGGFFGGDSSDTQQSGTDNNGQDMGDEDDFAVALVTINTRGELVAYKAKNGEELNVQWRDGNSFHQAAVNEEGIAVCKDKLDGDYRVSVTGLAQGYMYDPTAYVATNNDRKIQVEIHKVERTSGDGFDLYGSIEIDKTGVYSATLKSAEQIVYYMYTPKASGVYSVETWVDVEQNNVNPKLDIYNGTFASKYYSHTLDDGGLSSSYTKNAKYEIKIDEKEVGNNFTFGVKATQRNDKYPVTVYFAVKLDGGFQRDWITWDLIMPTFDFVTPPSTAGKTWHDPEKIVSGTRIFDGTMYDFHEEEGWYRKKNDGDEDGKPTGPILYAKISQACRFYDQPLTFIEYAGNKALTVENGTKNHKFFIEGRGSFRMGYFCVWHEQNQDYCPCMVDGCGGVCVDGCAKCHDQCRTVPQEQYDIMIEKGGYADYCNADGAYPVTQELKEFLQAFSISQSLFFDGNGHVETHPTRIYADEESQWLFACGYYA